MPADRPLLTSLFRAGRHGVIVRNVASHVFVRLFAILFVAGAACSAIAEEAKPLFTGPALREALVRGGFVLYFRHAATDFGQNDDRMSGYEDCAQQRNLTDAGRSDARAIGDAIKRLRIPVATVLASPFCRTRETAELIFGRATPDGRVRGGPARTDDPERYAALRALLSTPISVGTNLVIVSHGNPFTAVAGPPYLAEGEVAVVEPLGGNQFRVVGRIRVDGWSDYLR